MDTTLNKDTYLAMQKKLYLDCVKNNGYEYAKSIVCPSFGFDHGVGIWLYTHFFNNLYTMDKVALDFGCGVGRLIWFFYNKFKRIDGVDFSGAMLENAVAFLKEKNIHNIILYQCNGHNLECLQSDIYDIVYSGWVLQHICVYEIRDEYFREFYRVLKPGGFLCVQMECGDKPQIYNTKLSDWYSNDYDAIETNGLHDVKIDNIFELTRYFINIGFKDISLTIVPRQPKTHHKIIGQEFNLFIRCQKK